MPGLITNVKTLDKFIRGVPGTIVASATGNLLQRLAFVQAKAPGIKQTGTTGERQQDAIFTFDGSVNFAFGPWQDYIASCPADVLIFGINVNQNANTQPTFACVQIGVGGAGAESVRGSAWFPSNPTHIDGTGGHPRFSYWRFPVPIFVPSGSRVALRAVSSNNGGGGFSWLTQPVWTSRNDLQALTA